MGVSPVLQSDRYDADVLSITELKQMLSERELAPRKSLGQNFLIDHNLCRKLITASNLKLGNLVLEVGPGAGTLTQPLLELGCRVIACELDIGLADLIEERFPDENLQLIRGDCLASKHSINPAIAAAVAGEPFTLIANLPYSIASPLIMILLLDHPQCTSLWVTVQKEVADRLCASPGTKEFGQMSVIAQALAELSPVATLAPSCFWPQPKVASAMIGLTRRPAPRTRDIHTLQRLCQRLFTQRRKQLGTTLKNTISSEDWPADIAPTLRPEQLTIEQFESLAQVWTE
jgi:16S rRNA (adenine1518-N6/adenine1519-N6)-dimethyltransferase